MHQNRLQYLIKCGHPGVKRRGSQKTGIIAVGKDFCGNFVTQIGNNQIGQGGDVDGSVAALDICSRRCRGQIIARAADFIGDFQHERGGEALDFGGREGI